MSLHVGLLIPSNKSKIDGFDNTASAFTIALDRVKKERLLPDGTNFTITWRYEECVESTAIGYAFELIVNEKVDVIFAPPCIDGKFLLKKLDILQFLGAVLAGHVAGKFSLDIPIRSKSDSFDAD